MAGPRDLRWMGNNEIDVEKAAGHPTRVELWTLLSDQMTLNRDLVILMLRMHSNEDVSSELAAIQEVTDRLSNNIVDLITKVTHGA